MIVGDEPEVVGAVDLSWSRPLLRGNESDGLSERQLFERAAFLEEYFLIRLLEDGLNIEPRLELAGPSTSPALVPKSRAPISASILLSSKPVKSGEGTSTFVAIKNQQQKFKLQTNFDCDNGRDSVALVPLVTE